MIFTFNCTHKSIKWMDICPEHSGSRRGFPDEKKPATSPQRDSGASTNQDRGTGHSRAILEEGDDREYTSLCSDLVASRDAAQR